MAEEANLMRAWFYGFGAAAVAASGWMVGCSSDETVAPSTTGGTTTGGTTSTTTSGGGGAGGGTGGGATTTTTATGTTTGETTGAGGGTYQSCGECADQDNGAPKNECVAEGDACFGDPGCQAIFNCVFLGGNGLPPCDNTEAGACCTLTCYGNESQDSIDLYEAFDGCVYCDVCAPLCMYTDYCAVFEPGGGTACN
jgi:hypothetical protein